MARHTWHRTPNRNNNDEYRLLTAGARCLLRDLDEMLYREESLTANVSTLAGWFGLDRKTTREGIEAIAQTGLLTITKEERGKSGTFYTITDPKRTPNQPRTDPEPTPDQPQANPEQAPHTSASDAAFGDASLNRIEDKRENRIEDPPLPPEGGADTVFDEAWAQYPKRAGGNSRKDAKRCWDARVSEGIAPSDLLAATLSYRAFCEATGKIGQETVMQGQRFYGPNEQWCEDWTPPPKHPPNSMPAIASAVQSPARTTPEPLHVVALREWIAKAMAEQGHFPSYLAALKDVNTWPVERLEAERERWIA